jgi:hypothetical protein
VAFSAPAQYLLGLDEERVKEKAKEFGNNSNLTFKKTWHKDRAYFLNWYDDQIECQVMVAFNPYTDLSVITTLTPADKDVMAALKQGFEEMQFKKGKGWWLAKVEGKVLKIENVHLNKEECLVFREITPQELDN